VSPRSSEPNRATPFLGRRNSEPSRATPFLGRRNSEPSRGTPHLGRRNSEANRGPLSWAAETPKLTERGHSWAISPPTAAGACPGAAGGIPGAGSGLGVPLAGYRTVTEPTGLRPCERRPLAPRAISRPHRGIGSTRACLSSARRSPATARGSCISNEPPYHAAVGAWISAMRTDRPTMSIVLRRLGTGCSDGAAGRGRQGGGRGAAPPADGELRSRQHGGWDGSRRWESWHPTSSASTV
jgi:hypothetical protein